MQCVKSAKNESYVPASGTFRDRTIAEGTRDGRVHIFHLYIVASCWTIIDIVLFHCAFYEFYYNFAVQVKPP